MRGRESGRRETTACGRVPPFCAKLWTVLLPHQGEYDVPRHRPAHQRALSLRQCPDHRQAPGLRYRDFRHPDDRCLGNPDRRFDFADPPRVCAAVRAARLRRCEECRPGLHPLCQSAALQDGSKGCVIRRMLRGRRRHAPENAGSSRPARCRLTERGRAASGDARCRCPHPPRLRHNRLRPRNLRGAQIRPKHHARRCGPGVQAHDGL